MAVAAAFAAVHGIVPPLLPEVGGAFRLSDVGAAWIVSAFAVARLVIDVPAGLVADRVGRRRCFVAGGLLLSGGALLSALAPGPPALYLGRVLSGVGHGLTSLTLLLLVMAASPVAVRSRAGSLLEGVVVLGFLAIGLAAGPLSAAFDWRVAFGVAAAVGFFATFWGARLPWQGGEGPPADGEPAPAAASGRAAPAGGGQAAAEPAEVAAAPGPVAACFGAAFSIAFVWAGVTVTLMPLVAAGRLGLDATGIGQVLALSYAADLLLIFPVATMADRTGGRGVLTAALALSAAGAPAVLLAPRAGLLAAAVFVLGTTFAAWMVPAALLLRAVPADAHARTIGIYRFTTDVGFVLGPIVMAAAYERGSAPWAAAAAAAVPAAATAGMLLARRAAGRARPAAR